VDTVLLIGQSMEEQEKRRIIPIPQKGIIVECGVRRVE
jgi:hypothetical protein